MGTACARCATARGSASPLQSRLLKADHVGEIASLSCEQVPRQAGTVMLAQAKQSPKQMLSLLC